MKNSLRHFGFASKTASAMAIVGIGVFTAFAAGPSQAPTGGNVDANFNTVTTVGTISQVTGLNIAADGTITDNGGTVNVGQDFNVVGGYSNSTKGFHINGALGTLTIDQQGQQSRIYDNTNSPINIEDANGLIIKGPIFNQATFADGKYINIADPDGLLVTNYGVTSGLLIGPNGNLNNTIANQPVKSSDPEGFLSNATAAGKWGIYGDSLLGGGVYGAALINGFNGVEGHSFNQYGVYGVATTGTGVAGTGTIGGHFTSGALSVDLANGSTSAAVDAVGTIKNAALSILANGDITRTTANPVNVNNGWGLAVNSSTHGIQVDCTGTGNCLDGGNFITDGNNGIMVSASGSSSTGGRFDAKSMGITTTASAPTSTGLIATGGASGVIGNATAANGTGGTFYGANRGILSYATNAAGAGGYFMDSANQNRVTLSDATWAVRASGPIDAYGGAAGHITASGGFGGIYTRLGTPTVQAAGTEIRYDINCNNANHRALSFSFQNSGLASYMNDTRYDSKSGGHFWVKNTTAGSVTITPVITCLDPQGTW